MMSEHLASRIALNTERKHSMTTPTKGQYEALLRWADNVVYAAQTQNRGWMTSLASDGLVNGRPFTVESPGVGGWIRDVFEQCRDWTQVGDPKSPSRLAWMGTQLGTFLRQRFSSKAPGFSGPSTMSPQQVIAQGLQSLQQKAWGHARYIASCDPVALAELRQKRLAAMGGDWLARQYLTLVQSALNQMGKDPSCARWSADCQVGHEAPREKSEDQMTGESLVRRARNGDQHASALLQTLHEGGPRQHRILKFAKEYAEATGSASMGADKKSAHHAPAHHSTHHAPAHHAHAHHEAHPKGHAVRHPAVVKHAEHILRHPLPPPHPGHRPPARTRTGAPGSGSPSDQTLHPTTGQLMNQDAAAVVNAARAGDKNAARAIDDVFRAARAGDPRARKMAEDIARYTQAHPSFAGEIVAGHAMNLSHSHPLTPKRVQKIGKEIEAQFGVEGARAFFGAIESPYGPPETSVPAWTGQIVGQAQVLQASRFPGAPVRLFSPLAARELGE